MATCPRCKEFLGDSHTCRTVLKRRVSWLTSAVSAAFLGGGVGGVFVGVLGKAVGMTELQAAGVIGGLTTALVLRHSLRH